MLLFFFLKISFMNTIFCHQIHSLPSSNSCSPPCQLAFFSFHFLSLETKFNPSLLYLIILILLVVIISSSFSFFIFFSILPSLPLPPLLFLLWWVLENVTSDYNTKKRNILSSWNHYLSKVPHDLLGNHEPLPLCWRVQSCTGNHCCCEFMTHVDHVLFRIQCLIALTLVLSSVILVIHSFVLFLTPCRAWYRCLVEGSEFSSHLLTITKGNKK